MSDDKIDDRVVLLGRIGCVLLAVTLLLAWVLSKLPMEVLR